MRKALASLVILCASLIGASALAQVQQSGSVTRGHIPAWAAQGVVQDGGTSANPQVNAVAVYGSGGCPISITGTTTAGAPTGQYVQGCLSASNSGVQLSVTPFGGLATQPFIININGTTYSIGGTNWLSGIFDSQFCSTQGAVLYRSGTIWTCLTPGSSGQVLSTQGPSANPQWISAGGQGTVTSITAGNGLTGGTITSSGTIALSAPVSVANGGQGNITLAAHGVLIGNGTSAINVSTPGASGTVLQSNGASADPTWNAVAGTGTVTSITAADGTLTVSPSPLVTSGTIKVATNGVANANLAQMAGNTIKGNNTSGTANAADLTAAQTQLVVGYGPVAGTVRNLKIVRGSTTTLTITADQAVMMTTLSGLAYIEASASHTLTITNTGANGMDTGSAPTSGYICVYEITKGDGSTFASLGVNAATNSCPTIYPGANIPSGYVASGLIGIWPTDGSAHVVVGLQLDRHFSYQGTTAPAIFTGTTGASSPTSQSIAAGVPAVARTVDLLLATTTSTGRISPIFSADANGTGASASTLTGAAIGNSAPFPTTFAGAAGIATGIPISTAQTIFWMDSGGNSDNLYVMGYTF